MSIVDEVCPRGEGPQAVQRFISRHAPSVRPASPCSAGVNAPPR